MESEHGEAERRSSVYLHDIRDIKLSRNCRIISLKCNSLDRWMLTLGESIVFDRLLANRQVMAFVNGASLNIHQERLLREGGGGGAVSCLTLLLSFFNADS